MMQMTKEINMTISCWGYGYKGKVMINGINLGIQGGRSESLRLFTADSPFAKKASADQKRLFCLKPGKNTISVDCTKTSSSDHDKFEISLEAAGFPAPLLFMHTTSKSWKVEKEINLAGKDSHPVFFSDTKAVFVHVNSLSASVTPSLNGKEGMTISGMPGTAVLGNVQQGKNELSISYKGSGKLEVVIVTPKWTKSVALKPKDSEQKESFTFQ